VKLTTHLHRVPRLRTRGAILPLPQHFSMAWCLVKHMDNFTLQYANRQTRFQCPCALTEHHAMKTYWGSGGIAPLNFLTSALDGGEWSASRPGRFAPREKAPGTHWIGGWVGPRAVLDAVVKRKVPNPRRKSNPRTPIVQPVVQRYTD
jgi:hypothetical protein